MKPIEIEIDTPHNNNAVFGPLQRSIRGRFDFARAAKNEKNWHTASGDWGVDSIPAQRIGFDGTSGFVLEPLHLAEHAVLKAEIERRGMKLAPAKESFPLSAEAGREWLWAMQSLVRHGVAREVTGEFPSNLQPPSPKPGTLDPIDRLCGALESLLGRLAPKPA